MKWSGIGFDFLFGDFPGVKGLPMVDFHPPGLDAFSGENSSLLRLRTTPADFGVRGVAGYKKNERIKVLVGFQFDEYVTNYVLEIFIVTYTQFDL